jgi:Putative addiction module component
VSEDRSRLVELRLESLHEPSLSDIEAAWDAEIVRRVEAYKRGEVETFAAETFLRKPVASRLEASPIHQARSL